MTDTAELERLLAIHDHAWLSIWLHGDWRWLTMQMTHRTKVRRRRRCRTAVGAHGSRRPEPDPRPRSAGPFALVGASMISDVLWTATAVTATILAFAVFAVLVHGLWVAGEHVKAYAARRLNVPYRRQDPIWVRWINRSLRPAAWRPR
jgi:hypothetical protein